MKEKKKKLSDMKKIQSKHSAVRAQTKHLKGAGAADEPETRTSLNDACFFCEVS